MYAGQAPFDHHPRSLSQTQPVAQIPTSAQYGAFAIEMHAFEQFAGVPQLANRVALRQPIP